MFNTRYPLFWLVAAVCWGQEEVRVSSRPYLPALRVDTRVVDVVAVVRDSHGRAVAGLTQDDFKVFEDGKVRLIDHFYLDNLPHEAVRERKSEIASPPPPDAQRPEGPTPRFLAIFIDDVNATDGSMAAGLKRTQAAAEKFLKEALKSGVHIGVFTASGAPIVDFTSDEAKLTEAIAAVRAHPRMHEEGETGCPRITPYLSYLIAYDHNRSAMRDVLYDSGKRDCPVTQAAALTQAEDTWRKVKEITENTLNSVGQTVDRLGKMNGKRDLLMASSGFLAVSMQEHKDRLIERAIQAGVVINALDSKGIYTEAPPGSRPDDAVGYPAGLPGQSKAAQTWTSYELTEMPIRVQTMDEPLANLAEGTGGRFFHNNNDLNAGFRELGNAPEVTYHLSFHPEGVALDGGYHKLKVTAKKYSVQARPGYFAPNEKTAVETLQGKIDREIMAEDTVTDFPVGIALQQGKAAVGVIVSIDISKLRFTKQGDRQVQKIAFTTALFDAEGKIAAAKEGTMDLSLTEATYKRLAASGVNAKISLQVPSGNYKLRQVAEEAVDGKIACSTHAIEVK